MPKRPESSIKKFGDINEENKLKESSGMDRIKALKLSSNRPSYDNPVDPFNIKPHHNENPDNHNKLSTKRINFEYDIYGLYPDDNFKPSVFFFKFLAMKIGHHSERKSKKKKDKKDKYDEDEDESKFP
jgi:hypothetical protein